MDDTPELRDLLDALQEKAAKWSSIGIQLNLSPDELDIIRADSDGVVECLTGVLRKWQSKTDPQPTWKAVIEALKAPALGEAVLAAKLEERFAPRVAQSNERESKTSVEVARRNLDKIKQSFAKLLKDVATKLRTIEMDQEVFRFFIVNLFPPGNCIPHTANVITILEAVTQNGLWSYWHFTPVEKIVQEYAPNDADMKCWLDSYKKDLSGYKATTKIADAIEVYRSNAEEFKAADPSLPLPIPGDPAYLRRLSLKLEARVTEKTLEYVDELWLSLAEYFLLPSLSALLENIQRGCVEVSWLIPPHLVFQIVSNLQDNVVFLQSKGIVKVLLDRDCVYDEAQEKEFRWRLVDDVYKGEIDELIALLTSGVNINMTLETIFTDVAFCGTTLLMISAHKGMKEVLAVLLSYGADVSLQNKEGWTALMFACENGCLDIVEVLLEHSADTEQKTLTGWTAVMIACKNGHLNVVRLLVAKQANVGIQNKKGYTCLMAACQNGHLHTVEFLLTLPQVNVNAKGERGLNALMYASYSGNVDILEALVKHPEVDVNERSYARGCTALMFACSRRHNKCAECLLNHHSDVNIRDVMGWTALEFSCFSGKVQTVKLLLDKGVDPNTQDEHGWTPLMTASSRDAPDIAKELLNGGANPDIKNKNGETALAIACGMGHMGIVELLKSCTTVEVNADAPVTRSDPKIREPHAQLGLTHLECRVGLENRRIFREILEHRPEVLDPPKPSHLYPAPWHQNQLGEDLPES